MPQERKLARVSRGCGLRHFRRKLTQCNPSSPFYRESISSGVLIWLSLPSSRDPTDNQHLMFASHDIPPAYHRVTRLLYHTLFHNHIFQHRTLSCPAASSSILLLLMYCLRCVCMFQAIGQSCTYKAEYVFYTQQILCRFITALMKKRTLTILVQRAGSVTTNNQRPQHETDGREKARSSPGA